MTARRDGMGRIILQRLALLDLGQLLANLFVGRSFLVIHLDELPLHDAPRVNHVGRGMGPTRTVRVEYAVAIDHFAFFVFQQRKIELPFKSIAEHLAEFFGIFMLVDADREDLDFLFLWFRQ